MRKILTIALCAVAFSSSAVSAKEPPLDKQDREYMETMNDYCKYSPIAILTKMEAEEGEAETKRFVMNWINSYMAFDARHPDLARRLYKPCAHRSSQAFDLLHLSPDQN